MFAFPNAPSGPSQQPRYRKLIKQLLMNTIILKGTRHELRMGPSTTISEKMIFVSPFGKQAATFQQFSDQTKLPKLVLSQFIK